MFQALISLNPHSRRVLGALLEKEQTTPDYYPLTLNALISACNQTTNREPVMSMERYEVLRALHALERVSLVQRVTGPRADRWSHLLIQPGIARGAPKALYTVLLLRGSQTVGELKARTDRMYTFSSLEEVEQVLQQLAVTDPPLVVLQPPKPRQKESRWALHLEGEDQEAISETETSSEQIESRTESSLEARVQRLEVQMAELLELLKSDPK